MIVGIDLGTTNSAVAIWKDGASELIPNALGDFLTPSAVSIDKSGQSWVGSVARDRLATHPDETVTSFKRMMGTEATIKLGRNSYSAEELSAMVLASLARDVEATVGSWPEGVVITVPAYFNERQRRATRRAGEIAGLNVCRLINEPTAAALAFGLQDRSDQEPFLVFDLGGGTFDVSIVEMFDGIVEVRASAGDNRLGGDDFDGVMVKLARDRLEANTVLESISATRRDAILALAAERCRRQLSTENEALFKITVGDQSFSTMVTDEAFDAACENLLNRIRNPVMRAMRDTSLELSELSEIVLVGGATRMPVVRRSLTRMFGRFPNSVVHPDRAVALGAAVLGGLLVNDSQLEEIRITDVAPFTLGVEISDIDAHDQLHTGIFSPIIERNTAVPVSRSHWYRTMDHNQGAVSLGIYQGEARKVSSNVKLGEININVPKRPAGEVQIEVRFTYDTSGMLEVDVDVPLTGQKQSLVIVDQEDKRSRKEIKASRKALEKLKIHPRDEAENIAALARAERCFENFTSPLRDHIGQLITQFEGSLEKQDPRIIADARSQLLANLDAIETNPPI